MRGCVPALFRHDCSPLRVSLHVQATDGLSLSTQGFQSPLAANPTLYPCHEGGRSSRSLCVVRVRTFVRAKPVCNFTGMRKKGELSGVCRLFWQSPDLLTKRLLFVDPLMELAHRLPSIASVCGCSWSVLAAYVAYTAQDWNNKKKSPFSARLPRSPKSGIPARPGTNVFMFCSSTVYLRRN